jgi:hypothetical protein
VPVLQFKGKTAIEKKKGQAGLIFDSLLEPAL